MCIWRCDESGSWWEEDPSWSLRNQFKVSRKLVYCGFEDVALRPSSCFVVWPSRHMEAITHLPLTSMDIIYTYRRIHLHSSYLIIYLPFYKLFSWVFDEDYWGFHLVFSLYFLFCVCQLSDLYAWIFKLHVQFVEMYCQHLCTNTGVVKTSVGSTFQSVFFNVPGICSRRTQQDHISKLRPRLFTLYARFLRLSLNIYILKYICGLVPSRCTHG